MNISAASKAAGLPVKTVRYYADIGLVQSPSRSDAGYRTYDDASVRKTGVHPTVPRVRLHH